MDCKQATYFLLLCECLQGHLFSGSGGDDELTLGA